MSRPTDVKPVAACLYLLPVRTRMPLKFGPETLTEVTCARVKLTVEDRHGRRAEGWGETPLSVPWVWPSALPYAERNAALEAYCRALVPVWSNFSEFGHPMEVGHTFGESILPGFHEAFSHSTRPGLEPLPWLAGLVCSSAFDLALHDAYGVLHGLPTYHTYGSEFMTRDLASYLGEPERFAGRFPEDFLSAPVASLTAWHLVGGKDPILPSDRQGDEPDDGYPVTLDEWIRTDGLTSLKIKLRGDDAQWDYDRILSVVALGSVHGVKDYSLDFNCTVRDPDYVIAMNDRLAVHPAVWNRILYIEQPFPYDLHQFPIPVQRVSRQKPLFLDESAHDWKLVKYGKELGWTGVALKTCKTQTGALLSLCWAKSHGMALMVQDLTNPMLAQIPHVLLAAYAGTIRGVETNAMQFYPDASQPESVVHPGLYRRRNGQVDLSTIRGPGFGYRLDEIARTLPPVASESS